MSRVNPFKLKPQTGNLPRSKFDMSFVNNLTLRIGKITPVMCKEVIPGDSVSVDPSVFLKTMPMVKPILNNLTARLSFFYVRNRNLVDGWKDFIGKTDEGTFVMPYIKQIDPKFFNVGSLSDYLGVPCSYVGSKTTSVSFSIEKDYGYDSASKTYRWVSGDSQSTPYFRSTNLLNATYTGYYFDAPTFDALTNPTKSYTYKVLFDGKDPSSMFFNYSSVSVMRYWFGNVLTPFSHLLTEDSSANWSYLSDDKTTPTLSTFGYFVFEDVSGNERMPEEFRNLYPSLQRVVRGVVRPFDITPTYEDVDSTIRRWIVRDPEISTRLCATKDGEFLLKDYIAQLQAEGRKIYLVPTFNLKSDTFPFQDHFAFESMYIDGLEYLNSVSASTVSNPFLTVNNETRLPISALPYRAYESICNAWYRDSQNNPLRDADGHPVYNDFILNKSQGADTYSYDLRNCNWEEDVYTTAMASPQQGLAPLVGLRQNTEEVPIKMYELHYTQDGVEHTAKISADQRNEITGINITGDVKDSSGDLYEGLQQAITMGISINDFRNANALQRWLERNISRGYRYKEQMQSHFGLELSLEELDMPEYLGGCSANIQTWSITNQSDVNTGDEVGKGVVTMGTSKRINRFFDEHGFLMACLVIVPQPTYSSVLPKHFLKRNVLDYYFPEYKNIGPQSIKYSELCPVQTFNELNGSSKLDKVFGYQRSWYEYLSSFDEVHGEFRTTMKPYLMNREFAESPELGADFLEVDENQVNDVFAFTENSDKIFGQVKYDMIFKRQIPLIGEPRLE